MESMSRVVFATLLAAIMPCVHAVATESWKDVPVMDIPDGNVAFLPIGSECGTGTDAYYGYIGGNTSLKKVFIEIMGGAVCFNKASCEDTWLGAWMDITKYMVEKAGVPEQMVGVLKSGNPIPLTTFQGSIQPGYFPLLKSDDSHYMRQWPGIFFPTCTGDIMGGRHKLTYPGEDGSTMEAHHYGAINLNKVLDGVKKVLPELEEIVLIGGSGGAVTASVWMSRVADMWPTATVTTLVDSGFHMFPGSDFFKFYYDNIQWSNGPGGNNAGKVPNVEMPTWDWLNNDAIVTELERFGGRLRVAYVACDMDRIVFSDRVKMGKYSTFNGTTINQMNEMWEFLTNLHKCAPPLTAYSYVMSCDAHHLTRGGWGGEISSSYKIDSQPDWPLLSTFVNSFLGGVPPSSSDVDKTAFWFESRSVESEGGTCPATTTAATTPAGETQVDAGIRVHLGVWSCFAAVVATLLHA